MKKWLTTALLVTIAWPVAAQMPAGAASGTDERWAPWLGCWQPDWSYRVRGGPRVCVVIEGTSAVTRIDFDGARVAAERTVSSGGEPYPAIDGNCRGTEVAIWGKTRPALYRRTESTCAGERRTLDSLWFIAPNRRWVDVTVREVGGAKSVRVRRYLPSGDQELPDHLVGRVPPTPEFLLATDAADVPWTVAHVIEASSRLPREGVEAALMEAGERFDLDAATLVEMSDAGVASSVIDLMVALTYPEKFRVDRVGGTTGGLGGWSENWLAGPIWLSFFGPYDSSFGYQGYDYYWVPVGPGNGGTEGIRPGKVIKGFGYTQVSVRDHSSGAHGRVSGGAAGGSPSGDGSSGNSASPSGYSSGSSGAGSDRTAVPRGPGN